MNLRKDHYRRFLLSILEERYTNLFRTSGTSFYYGTRKKGNTSAVIAAPDGHSFDAPCVLSRLPISGPPIYPREWEASRPSPSGRSAVWRRAAWPGTLGRPGVQVAKGSSILISSSYHRKERRVESVRVRVGRWQVARSARSNESRASLRRKRPATAWILPFFYSFFFLSAPTERGT